MSDYNLKRLEDAVSYSLETGSFCTRNIIKNSDYFCIWGAGLFFQEAYERYFLKNGIRANYVIDQDKSKTGKIYFDHVHCISPNELFKLKNPVVMPLMGKGRQDVIDICESNGISWIEPYQYFFEQQNMRDEIYSSKEWFNQNTEKILNLYHMLHDDESKFVYSNVICNHIAKHLSTASYDSLYTSGQYFAPVNLYKLGENESFLDIGAYNGDTLYDFLKCVNKKFNHIYCFEMSKNNFVELTKAVHTYPQKIQKKITCYNIGAWNKKLTLRCGEENVNSGTGFSISKGVGDFLKNEESEYAKCDCIDSIIKDRTVTLLKMDIEGAEQQALEGAREIIKKQSPKLALCIYHSLKDLWEIPMWIKATVPEYHIAIRHHTVGTGDTVCYAWI